MSTIRVVNLQHTDATEPNIVLLADGTSVFASGITISGGTNLTVSGTAEFASGTVSAPGITFIDDNNTGLYSPATDTVAITTAATERVRVDSAGNVGIGTATPDFGLHLHSSSSYFKISNSGTGEGGSDGMLLGIDGTGNIDLWNYENKFMRFATNNTERMRIDSAGNIGIGTTSPSTSLHIKGAADSYLTLQAGTTSGNNGILFQNSAGTQKGVIFFDTDDDYMLFSTNNTERMRIDSSGNVGIGVTTVSADLHIGSAQPTIRLQDTTTNCLAQITSDDNGNIYLDADLGNTRASSSIRFLVDTSERMRLDSSGNVGIGIAAPAHRMVVRSFGANPAYLQSCNDSSGIGATAGVLFGMGSATDAFLWNYENGNIIFATNSTERMRIDSSGNLLVGTTTLFGSDGITLTNAGAIVSPQVYGQVVSSSPRDVYVDSVGLFGYISSIRESKANIRAQSNVDWIYQLEPVTFNYKSRNLESGEYTGVESDVEYGLIAEDVESICPELCFYDKTNDGQKLSGIHYRKLITPMLKALQDANSKIKTLEQRLSDAGIA